MGVQFVFDKKAEKGKKLIVSEPESYSALQNGCYGKKGKGKLFLMPEEALYIMDIRNGVCKDPEGNPVSFSELMLYFKVKKFIARYFAYKNWRDRGLIARSMDECVGGYGRSPIKRYPSKPFSMPKHTFEGVFFADDLTTISEDQEIGKKLYEDYWLGQFGTYKAQHRGKLTKYDVYETLFLLKHSGLKLKNATEEKVIKAATRRRSDFPLMYDVYEDWRLRGFILKTGFKFGTHFRVYFPGASPVKKGKEWVHSKHVLQVFPRTSRMLISEWARAIRVAHSVRKTFILAIPGEKSKREKEVKLDFLLYHRKRGGIEKPGEDRPKYVMLALNEEEKIGGAELASAIKKAADVGLDLMLAISDRESAITYYRVKRILLPGSKYEYYEIEWKLP